MSIRATDILGNYVGDVTISKNENEDGSRDVYKTGTSNESLTPLGRIKKGEHGWTAVAASGYVGQAPTRTRVAGILIGNANYEKRRAYLQAAKDRTHKIAADVLEEYPTGPEHDLAALFQSINPVIHGIDAGYNPKGRDVLVAGRNGFIIRGTLTGVTHPASETQYESYQVELEDGYLGTVSWGLVIPQEILDAEAAARIPAEEQETAEAIIRVERFLDVYETQRNADPEVVYSLPRVQDRDDLAMNELRVADLRRLVATLRNGK